MRLLLFLLLLLPAIGRAQLKLRVINPTKYGIVFTYNEEGNTKVIDAYDTSTVLGYKSTLLSQEVFTIMWYRRHTQGWEAAGTYTHCFNMHVEPITKGEWYLYLYPDHTDSAKWVVYPIPKTGVQ